MKVELHGTRQTENALQGVKAGVKNRVLKRALRQVSSSAAKVAKSRIRGKRTGALKRSLGVKYKSYRSSGVFVFAIGPRKGYRTSDAAGGSIDPARYAHFAERGRKAVVVKKARMLANRAGRIFFGKRVEAAQGIPFMRPAFAHAQAESGGSGFRGKVAEGVRLEAGKHGRKGKSIYDS
ncbi:MAG: HK97 gp10 family phage protein [Fimbriiglobus sp.]